MNFVTAAFQFLANLFGYSKQRSEQRNREDMVKRKEAEEENRKQDEFAKAIKENDMERMRKEISE